LLDFLISFFRSMLHSITGMGPCCRFVPTCSQYGQEAMRYHGLFRGSALLLRRLLKCHPFGPSGYDPVPGGCQHGI
jgi:uncharacterized protein